MRTSLLLLCLALVGCLHNTEPVKPLKAPDPSKIPDARGYVEDGRLVAGPPLPGLRFAPSEGTCAPEAPPYAFTACCGGKACNGHCVYADDGSSVCSCLGELGGCKEGKVCSKLAHRCVKAETGKDH